MSDYDKHHTHHRSSHDTLDHDTQPATKEAGEASTKPRTGGGPAPKGVTAGPADEDRSNHGVAKPDNVPEASNLKARIIGRWTEGSHVLVLVGAGAAQGVMEGMDAVVNVASGPVLSHKTAANKEGVSTVTENTCLIAFAVSHDQLLKESGMRVTINPR